MKANSQKQRCLALRYRKFVEERFQNLMKPVTERLRKNNLLLFSSPSTRFSSIGF